jgi:hypothetical protein
VKPPDNAPSEPSPQPGNSNSAAKTATGPAQSKAKAKVRSTHKRTGAKPATAKRIKRPERNGAESKQDRVIALLRRREGATLAALVKATSWQPHSIRGFLAGTIRKKLKLPLISEKSDGTRIYRIAAGKTAKTAKTRARSA